MRCMVLRHPACTAATAPERRSAMRMGAQSATRTTTADVGSSLTTASASGRPHSSRRPTGAEAIVRPCACRSSNRRSGGTPASRATSAHSLSRSRNSIEPSVKKWGAISASGRQRRTRPHGACAHSNPPLGWGSVMEIIGLGFDATDIPRVADLYTRYGDRFLRRVFTEGEIAYCKRRRDPVPSLAGRFAAKEAAMKALGTGHSRGVIWTSIEVVRAFGPPQLRLHGGAAEHAARLGVRSSLLTITHSEALAMAQVLLLGA